MTALDRKVSTTRYPDWPERLNAYILSVKDERWEMGTFDCCVFAAGAVKAMTGTDPMDEFRDQYTDWDTSDKALTTLGVKDLYRTLRSKFGKPVRGVKGRKGDVAFYLGNCGIMLGTYGMFLGEEGFVYVKLTSIQRAFRIT